jgi:hypothetical protein
MRAATQEEAERWTALAEAHGFTNETGDVALGRFIVESVDESGLTLRFITPLVAGLYTEELEKKTPPVMFGPDGERRGHHPRALVAARVRDGQ